MKILLYIVITILFIFGNAFLRSRIEKRNFDPFQVRMESPEVSEPAESNSYGEDMEESGPSEPDLPGEAAVPSGEDFSGEAGGESVPSGEGLTGQDADAPSSSEGIFGENTDALGVSQESPVRRQDPSPWETLQQAVLQLRNSYTQYGELEGLGYQIRDGRAIITGYGGEEENITLPAVINGFAVTEIGAGAFWGNTRLKSLVSKGNIEIVGDRAFAECAELENVEIGDRISKMGRDVLSATRLRSRQQMEQGYVTLGNMLVEPPVSGEFFIPDNVTGIGADCFRENENVTQVVLPEGFLYLGEEAFAFCPNLTRAVFPAGMEEIGNGAFSWCENIVEITFEGGVRRIGDSAFEGCGQYGDITFPEGLEEIGARAFWECGQMTSIVIPGTVKKIGDGAFCNLGMLGTPQEITRLELKEGVEQVGREAFQYIMAREILLPDSLVMAGENAFTVTEEMEAAPGMYVADGVLLQYTGEETTPAVPEGVRMILGNAFRNNQNIVSVELPAGLRCIGGSAFEDCGELSWMTIPDSVEVIGDRAFANCGSLTVVDGYEEVARKGKEIFASSGMAGGE